MKPDLTQICKDLEAYETPRWAVEALLDVEILTQNVFDPCVGLGSLVGPIIDAGYDVTALDYRDWGQDFQRHFDGLYRVKHIGIGDFLGPAGENLTSGSTVVMNPPFTLACEFVDRAKALGARKIICFQRQAWRESETRREWWQNNRPARVWVCGARATCWRFDMLECQHEGGKAVCDKKKVCQHCSAGSSVAMAWYVWEQGHTGAEITNAIYPKKVAS
jgi:hypothetical protein